MYEDFGPFVDGNNVEFRLFFPTNQRRGGDPQIKQIKVRGSFAELPWDLDSAPVMISAPYPTGDPKGTLYTATVKNLSSGLYQYKFYVTFQNGKNRWCIDPCTKYGGTENNNSAFIIGEPEIEMKLFTRPIQTDLVVYELMIDDFAHHIKTPDENYFDAIQNKIPHLASDLKVNCVEFMPWTDCGGQFNWGYMPFAYFAVENRYGQLHHLKELINALHGARIAVIMDGVFNHVDDACFGYHHLYQNPDDSPFTGPYMGEGFGLDLDFTNDCAQEFVFDVCKYWFDSFAIDGIRFDYTLGFYDPNDDSRGLPKLIKDLKQHLQATQGQNNPAYLMLEHLSDNRYDAIDVANRVSATGCWFDMFLIRMQGYAAWWFIDQEILRILDAGKDFAPEKEPLTYIENHDHSTFMVKVGGRYMWWRSQPYAIALFTTPGVPMIHNGQEFADEYWLPEHGVGRVIPRPVHWDFLTDECGRRLLALYQKLIEWRKEYPSLRTKNFYPYYADEWKKVVAYHRWGYNEKFVIVLNFSGNDQWVNIPFSDNGPWQELLEGRPVEVRDWMLWNQKINSNWGKVFYKKF